MIFNQEQKRAQIGKTRNEKKSRPRRFKKICTGLKHLYNAEKELDKSEFVFNPHKTLAYLFTWSRLTLCNPINL